jgi:hypothetical protein
MCRTNGLLLSKLTMVSDCASVIKNMEGTRGAYGRIIQKVKTIISNVDAHRLASSLLFSTFFFYCRS